MGRGTADWWLEVGGEIWAAEKSQKRVDKGKIAQSCDSAKNWPGMLRSCLAGSEAHSPLVEAGGALAGEAQALCLPPKTGHK